MRKIFLLSFVCLLLLLLAACAVDRGSAGLSSPRNSDSEAPLDFAALKNWVEKDLVAAIKTVLANNREVRGLPCIIVAWDEEKKTISSKIDGFSYEVRQMLISALLREPENEMELAVRSRPLDLQHHTDRVNCDDYRDIGLYVLLNTRYSRLSGRLIIEVNGATVDNETFRYIQGLSSSFELKPEAATLALLKNSISDEYLRGLRYLPFAADQYDLLATYLARRLTCVLRENFNRGEYAVCFVENPEAHGPFQANLMQLVENYLNKFHEIRVVSDPNRTNILLACNIPELPGDFIQVWISSEDRVNHQQGPSVDGCIKKK